ncbi:MAG: TlpA disulfide reductase family protein, partial [Bacteroidota bacterium]
MKKLIFVVLPLIIIGFPDVSEGQVFTVTPENPQVAQPIEITYHPEHENAGLKGEQQVYAGFQVYYQDGSMDKRHQPLQMQNDTLRTTFIPPEMAAAFELTFYSYSTGDRTAKKYVMLRDKKRRLVQGAFGGLVIVSTDSVLQLALSHFPEDYSLYGQLFQWAIPEPYSEAKSKALTTYMPLLEKKSDELSKKGKKQLNDVGLLFSLGMGYIHLEDLEKGKAMVLKLLEMAPTSRMTMSLESAWLYGNYKLTGDTKPDAEVKEAVKRIATTYPTAPVVAAKASWFFAEQKELSFANFQEIYSYALKKSPYDARSRLEYVKLFLSYDEDLENAEQIALTAVEHILSGAVNHNYPQASQMGAVQRTLPGLYRALADIQWRKEEYTSALLYLNAAIDVSEGSNYAAKLIPDLMSKKAEAYQKIGNLNLAMHTLIEDYKREVAEETLDKIRGVYLMQNGTTENFETFWKKKMPQKAKTSNKNAAPDFNAKDLDGNTLSLAQLKGKVVVVNFWGIGCGPCIVEMPELNELVKRYQGMDGVFIGFTGDSRENLEQFFKKKEFDYQIVARARSISQSYGVSGIPVHIIID